MFQASYPMHEAFHTASSPSSVGKFLSCYALCISTTGEGWKDVEYTIQKHWGALCPEGVSCAWQGSSPWVHPWNEHPLLAHRPRTSSRHRSRTLKIKNMSIYIKFPTTFLSRAPWHSTPARPPVVESLNKGNNLKWRIILNGSGQHPVLQPSRCKERGTTPTALQTENLPPEWQLGVWRRISSDHVWPGFMYRGMAWNMLLVAIKMWDKHPPDS